MNRIFTQQLVARLITLSVSTPCITLGFSTPSWGDMATRNPRSSLPRESDTVVENVAPLELSQQQFPSRSPAILELISQIQDQSCNLSDAASNQSDRTNVAANVAAIETEINNIEAIDPVNFRHQLNCIFLSPENHSQAALIEGLQVDYQSNSDRLFSSPGDSTNPGEPPEAMVAQRSYYDDDEPSIVVTPRAGVGGTKGIYGGLNFQVSNLGNNNGIINLNLEGGEKTVGASFSYTDPWVNEDLEYDFGYRITVFNSRNPERNFLNGDREVNLIHDHTPWVDRLGGGIEFFQPVSDNGVILAFGAGYQRVAIRNAGLTDAVFSRDELDNRVTVGNDGIDPLLTLGLGLFQDRRDNPTWPTEGYRFRVSSQQSIPIGDEEITMNRLVGSYSQFIPMGSSAIAFGVEAGTIIGDAPPYQAFEIGGGNSVRGYGGAEVGSGRSFVTTAVEYRFLIADDLELPFISRVGGTFFFDYGTDLGSGDTVIGEPAEVRNKPGNGFGGGAGVRLLTPFGQVRGEVGMNDEGDFSFHVELGDRF
jgi:hypothetical protein